VGVQTPNSFMASPWQKQTMQWTVKHFLRYVYKNMQDLTWILDLVVVVVVVVVCLLLLLQ